MTTTSGKKDKRSNRYIKNLQYVNAPDKPKIEVSVPSIDDVSKASQKQKLLKKPETAEEANSHIDLDFDEAITITHNMLRLVHGLEYYIKEYSDAHDMHYRNKVSACRADAIMQLCLLKYSANKVAKLLDCEDQV